MLSRFRRCRIIGAITLACFASACVTTSNHMTPETFSAMKDAEIFIVRAQPEIDIRITAHPVHADQYQAGGAYVHVPVNTGGGGGGGAAAAGILIFAAIAIAVANSVKQKKANEWIAPVREAVPDAEVEERLKHIVDRDFRSIPWIKPVPVPILDDTKSVVLEEKLYTSKADAVGIVTPYYQFDYSMTTLRVGMYFELFSASAALTKVVGKSQSVPYYAVHRYWDVSVPADRRGETEAHAAYWSAENAKHTRAALAEGLEFATAQVRATLRDPQIYRPNQVIVQKPAAIPETSKSFKTVAERDNWYAIRFSETEQKWNSKGGEATAENKKREFNDLADECRAAAIKDKTAAANDEGCVVKVVLEKTATAKPGPPPPRLDNAQGHSGAETIRTTEETPPNKIASLPSQTLKEKTNPSSYWANTTWRSVNNGWRIKIEYSEFGDFYDAELYNHGNEMFCSGDVFKSGRIETSICTGTGYSDRQLEGTVFKIFLEDNGNQGGARFVFRKLRDGIKRNE